MSALEPGLYRATVRGIPGDSIILVGNGLVAGEATGESVFSLDSKGYVRRCYVYENARPLTLLDLPPERVQYVLDVLGRPAHSWTNIVAAQIEAQTKPARIPEPGLWGVVRASLPDNTTVSSWIHVRGGRWFAADHGFAEWDVLVYPTIERDGIES